MNWGDPPLYGKFFFRNEMLYKPKVRSEPSTGRESEGHIVPMNAGQHNLREGRRPALFKLFKEVRVSECHRANDTNGKSSTTPREARSCCQDKQKQKVPCAVRQSSPNGCAAGSLAQGTS